MRRRTFMTGVGATTGLGILAGPSNAKETGMAYSLDAVYYVYRADERYLVASSPTGDNEFDVQADGNAEQAFQYVRRGT